MKLQFALQRWLKENLPVSDVFLEDVETAGQSETAAVVVYAGQGNDGAFGGKGVEVYDVGLFVPGAANPSDGYEALSRMERALEQNGRGAARSRTEWQDLQIEPLRREDGAAYYRITLTEA